MIIVVDISSAVRVRHGDNEKKYKRSSCTSTTFRNVITWNTPRRDKKMNRAYTRSTCKVDSKYLSYISTASQQQKEKRSSHIVEHQLIPPSDHHIPINLNNAVFVCSLIRANSFFGCLTSFAINKTIPQGVMNLTVVEFLVLVFFGIIGMPVHCSTCIRTKSRQLIR